MTAPVACTYNHRVVKSRRREIRFEPEQVERGDQLAQEMGLTFSDIVRLALNDYLKKHNH